MRARPVDRIISEWRQTSFVWGASDCCAFCNYVVNRLTGGDWLLPIYHSAEEAEALATLHGDLSAAVGNITQLPEIDEPRPGDLCLIQVYEHQSLGVMRGNGDVAVIFENSGLRSVPAGFINTAWAIEWE